MTKPFVSVIIETVTARYDSDAATGSLADDLIQPLRGLARQTYPRDRFEIIVVIDDAVEAAAADALLQRYPDLKLVRAGRTNYFSAKNAGARASKGEIIVLLDGDCEPAPEWLDTLIARLDDGTAVVAGNTRYRGDSLVGRTFSVPDFANVAANPDGSATGILVNNVAFRRDVFLAHPFDERIRRNGGCYLLYYQLCADGVKIAYEPRARVAHGLDIGGLGFVRKHFDRGFDGVSVYRCDDRGVLRGTSLFRRVGGLALFPITLRRVALDWMRLALKRRQIGIATLAVPYYAAIALGTRLIELAGGLTAVVSRRD